MPDDSPPTADAPATGAALKAQPKLVTFTDFFQQIGDGRTASDATDQLQVLVRELKHIQLATNGKPKGRLRIEIEVLCNGGVMDVIAEIKTTMPKPPRERTVFFPTKDNTLSSVNAQQQEMEFKDVSTAGQPVRRLVPR